MERTLKPQDMIERARALAPRFAERAAVTEEARRLPSASVQELLDAGIARILVPPRFGGYALDFDTWFEVAREISKADASHGWCASLMCHHAHMVSQFPDEAQHAVWGSGPDVAIAASIMPSTQVAPADGGYCISGQHSAFASGIDHSSWAILGGFSHRGHAPEWLFFLIPSSEFEIRDTWYMTGMRGTGSKTIITENVFVPASRVLSLADLRVAKGPGAALNEGRIFQTPFFFYAPLTFAAPMLGAAQGAYEHFREWTKTRKTPGGALLAERPTLQQRMARAAANLDAAELLLLRAARLPAKNSSLSPELLSRSVRDFTRSAELIVDAIDTLIALSGTAGFAESHPIQRAWRDIHLASMHISLNGENNYAHFSRMELGLGRDPNQPFF